MEIQSEMEAMPEGSPPSAATGSDAVAETVKLVAVVCAGRLLTVLVGGAVSISHDLGSEPEPARPSVSVMSAALIVSL